METSKNVKRYVKYHLLSLVMDCLFVGFSINAGIVELIMGFPLITALSVVVVLVMVHSAHGHYVALTGKLEQPNAKQ